MVFRDLQIFRRLRIYFCVYISAVCNIDRVFTFFRGRTRLCIHVTEQDGSQKRREKAKDEKISGKQVNALFIVAFCGAGVKSRNSCGPLSQFQIQTRLFWARDQEFSFVSGLPTTNWRKIGECPGTLPAGRFCGLCCESEKW